VLTIIAIAGIIIMPKMIHTDRYFERITARRIKIVEQEAKFRIVISNHHDHPQGSYNGKDLPKRDRPAGTIFFIMIGMSVADWYTMEVKKERASAILDQYKNGQIKQIQYV
jgi:hypothetical protein